MVTHCSLQPMYIIHSPDEIQCNSQLYSETQITLGAVAVVSLTNSESHCTSFRDKPSRGLHPKSAAHRRCVTRKTIPPTPTPPNTNNTRAPRRPWPHLRNFIHYRRDRCGEGRRRRPATRAIPCRPRRRRSPGRKRRARRHRSAAGDT